MINTVFPSREIRPTFVIEYALRIRLKTADQFSVTVQPSVLGEYHFTIFRRRSMIRGKVDNYFNIIIMRRFDQFREVVHRAEKFIGTEEISAPISVISCRIIGRIDRSNVFYRRRYPNGSYSHIGQITVLDFICNSFPISAVVFSRIILIKNIAGRIIRRITVIKSVGHNLINGVRRKTCAV